MGEGRVDVEEARLCVCHVDLSPNVYNDVAKSYKKTRPKYTYMKSDFYVIVLTLVQLRLNRDVYQLNLSLHLLTLKLLTT